MLGHFYDHVFIHIYVLPSYDALPLFIIISSSTHSLSSLFIFSPHYSFSLPIIHSLSPLFILFPIIHSLSPLFILFPIIHYSLHDYSVIVIPMDSLVLLY